MLLRRHGFGLTAALVLAACAPVLAQAQAAYPDKTVRILVPYAAGGSTDPVARLLADRLTKQTGQPFFVENKPGAGGRIGIAEVLRLPPDGYNVLAGPSGIAINPSLTPKGSYDVDKDMTPIALMSRIPMIIVASQQSGFKSIADVVKAARDKPGSVNYGITGIGTMDHLVSERFRANQKLDMVRIDYNGVPAALTALIGGQIPLMTVAINAGMAQIKAGKVVPLAITSSKRAALLPGIPTMAEAGIPDFVMYGWSAMFTANGTPPAISQKLHDEVAKAMSDPEVQQIIIDSGSEPANLSLPELKTYMRKDVALFGDIVRSNHIHVD
ncbi:MAG: tripartite tricarboxylate transporter substrate binding protein [Pseudomonadota bacterium]